jgi:hypothetical protein
VLHQPTARVRNQPSSTTVPTATQRA